MAITLAELLVRLGLDATAFGEGIDGVDSDLQKFADKLDNIGGALTKAGGVLTAAFTVPIAGAGIAATKFASDFDLAMRQVTSLLGGASQQQFKALSDQTLELSKRLGIDAVGAAQALYEAISAGVPAENAIGFLEVASKAAIAGVTNTKVAVDGLTNIMNAFGISFTDAQKVADAMFQSVNIGKFTFEQLASSVGIASGTAAKLGVDFTELLAAAATITKQGFSVSEAMTSIQSAMVGILTPNKQMNALFEQMGVTSGEALIRSKGLEGALIALSQASGGNNQVMAEALGRVEALRAALALTGENAKGAAADFDVIRNSTGAASMAFAEIEKSATRQFQTVVNQLKATAIEFGITLLPAVGNLLEATKPLLGVLSELVQWFAALPQPAQTAGIAIAAAVAAIGPILATAGLAAQGLSTLMSSFGLLVAATGPLIAAVGNVVTALQVNAVGALTAGEMAILRIGQAVAVAAAAFAGWKIGEWAYENIPGVQALGDAISGLILKIPGVEAVLLKLSGASSQGKAANESLAQSVEMLEKKLAAKGIVVERGNKTLEEYSVALRRAAIEAAPVAQSAEAAAKSTQNLAVSTGNAAQAAKQAESDQKMYEASLKRTTEEKTKLLLKLIEFDQKIKTAHTELVAFDQSLNNGALRAELDRIGVSVQATAAQMHLAFMSQVPEALQAAINKVKQVDDAFAQLGIQSSAVLSTKATKAQEAYEIIRASGTASARDIQAAELAALQASIEARRAAGETISQAEQKRLEDLQTILGEHVTKQKTIWDTLGQQVSTIFTDMSRGIVDAIFQGKNLGEVFMDSLEQMGKAVLRFVVEYLEGKLFKALAGLLDNLLPSIGGALSGIFGSVGSVAGGVAGAAGSAAGGVASAAGGAASAVGGVASGIMGALNPIGAIGSAVSAITGVIGMFHSPLSGDMGKIEESTRYSKIILGDTLEEAVKWWPRLFDINYFNYTVLTELLGQINDALRFDLLTALGGIRDVLTFGLVTPIEQIRDYMLMPPGAQLAPAVPGGVGAANIHLYINGREVAAAIVTDLEALGIKP